MYPSTYTLYAVICTVYAYAHTGSLQKCKRSHENSYPASLLNQHSACPLPILCAVFFNILFYFFNILFRIELNIMTFVYLKINVPAALMLKIIIRLDKIGQAPLPPTSESNGRPLNTRSTPNCHKRWKEGDCWWETFRDHYGMSRAKSTTPILTC